MSWRKLVPHIYSAAKVTATGASITLGSTVFSCYLALQIEAASHRTIFAFFPHWYANVEYANGIDPDLLASVRMQARLQQQEQVKRALLQPQQSTLKNQEDDTTTKTIFTVEGLVEPMVKQVQLDLSACAMTA
ncbi:expressed unknown protein [Seminavis robusta]|uniref:Uncharacterized protein n=1 Tax=Seminavis robusta TaxID=568900 RepID=A0A9N8H9D5_9STRA|nr:expressed unknown protein [Seminavis robusta]|eukprot:Sro271_g104610.1 n/a (133) ;mRNA; f:53281-53679